MASIAIVLPQSGRVYLVDATPDFPEQLARVAAWMREPTGGVDRDPLDGIILTHAHMGHYLGLAWLGFEAVHARGVPLYVTPSMARFLSHHAPWERLVAAGNVTPVVLELEQPLELGDGVTVIPFTVPHRAEYTDTLGLRIEGAARAYLYVPDTDSWNAWDPPLEARLRGVGVAFLDGTFFSARELPDRDVSRIGHPLVEQTLQWLEELRVPARVYFTHLNHSNPLVVPGSPERRRLEARGFGVLDEGTVWGL